MRVRISVVTPSLNQGPWLEDNLHSISRSAASLDIEHFVMDGGSTDQTVEILTGQDLSKWVSEPDHGQTDAINKGLSRATGDILTYLCADDYYEPTALEQVAEAFQKNPEMDVVYGDGYFLESDSGWKRLKRAGDFSKERLRRHNFLLQPAVFFRRSVYERFGAFDASLRYCMDHEYWLRISPDTRWLYLRTPLATCRLHSGAKTSRALASAWWEAAMMQSRYGMTLRPRLDALWMQYVGQYYYRLKRSLFAFVGKNRRP